MTGRTTATIGRRAAIAGASAALAAPRRTSAAAPVTLGLLQFGTVQWVSEIIGHDGLDAKHGFALATVMLANTDAGRIALMGGRADVVVSDWPFVAVQRAAGTRLCFSPFSTAAGAVMVRQDSPIRSLADLKGRRLGVAGGPVDKSWLVVQAAAHATAQLDLVTAAQIAYGAPPLMGAKLEQGELDAVLTFWNFAAKLEAAGFRQAVSVADCATALGLPPQLGMVGFVFREDWARTGAADPFLAAAAEAVQQLVHSDAAWARVRPLMDAPNDAVFERLRARFIAGASTGAADADAQERTAERVFALVRETGGTKATGGLDALPPGIFWQAGHANG